MTMKQKSHSDEGLESPSASSSTSSSSLNSPKRSKSLFPRFRRHNSADTVAPTNPTTPATPATPPLVIETPSHGSTASVAAAPVVATAPSVSASEVPASMSPRSLDQLDGYVLLAEIFRRNGGALVLFTDYCEQGFCDELVHCYQSIMDYKAPDRTPEPDLEAAAQRIHDIYLRYGSNQEVNASLEATAHVQQAIKESACNRKSFDLLLADITPLLLQQLILLKASSHKDRLASLLKADSRF